MFKQISMYLSIFLLLFQPISYVSADGNDDLRAAFIKNDDLWLKNEESETKITNGKYVRYPKWSFDGEWIAYISGVKQEYSPLYSGELWIYHPKTKQYFKVSSNVNNNFQWSPMNNLLAFQIGKDLMLINVKHNKHSQKVTTSILNFSWLPDGSGFLTSSKTNENVFSDIILSKINLKNYGQNKKNHFYTIHVGQNDNFYDTSQFKWSNDRKWIAFEVQPTGSLSADSNVLSIISNNGTNFKRIDDMLHYEEWFQWAPTTNYLGFIKGSNRVSTINKKLTISNIPKLHTKLIYTPNGYVDRDLTWKSNLEIYVTRSVESDLVEIPKRPLPSIYQIKLNSNLQKKVTFPLKNEGDFNPISIKNGRKLMWIRTNREEASVLMSNFDGSNPKKWIPNLDLGTLYYEHWDWNEVFSVYKQ